MNRFLLQVMPARITHVGEYDWWWIQNKSGESPRIRVALRKPAVEEREQQRPVDPAHFLLDVNHEEGACPESTRVTCHSCLRRTALRVVHCPKPMIRWIMNWTLCQMVLPVVKPLASPYVDMTVTPMILDFNCFENRLHLPIIRMHRAAQESNSSRTSWTAHHA